MPTFEQLPSRPNLEEDDLFVVQPQDGSPTSGSTRAQVFTQPGIEEASIGTITEFSTGQGVTVDDANLTGDVDMSNADSVTHKEGSVTQSALGGTRHDAGVINVNSSTIVVDTLDFEPSKIMFYRVDTTGSFAVGSYGVSIGTTKHFSGAWSRAATGDEATTTSQEYSILSVSASSGGQLRQGYVSATASNGFTVTMDNAGDNDFLWIAER